MFQFPSITQSPFRPNWAMEEDQNDSAFFSPYEAQLFALFKSCDQPGKGVLDREGLSSLCKKLGLDNDQSQKLLVSFTWLGIFTHLWWWWKWIMVLIYRIDLWQNRLDSFVRLKVNKSILFGRYVFIRTDWELIKVKFC